MHRTNDFDKDFERTGKIAHFIFIASVVVMIVGCMVAAIIVNQICEKVSKDGLKEVIERIWNGEQK